MEITRRIDLNLGCSCNIRCRFCYYQKSVNAGKKRDLSTEQAKRWIRFFRKAGKEEIDLTGGEPTIRRDIFELISYCRELSYKKICVITNGIMLADKSFCDRLVESGLNDILFSLHGPDSAIHDSLTCFEGSFDKLRQAARNMAGTPVRMRSNTVVNGISYRHLEAITVLLKEWGMQRVNFILFNPIVEAGSSDAEMNLKYEDAAVYLKKVVDRFKDDFEKITIRYMPFCIMPGYEQYITNMPQLHFDPDEWDYCLRTRFRNGLFMYLAALTLGLLAHPSKKRLFRLGWEKARHEAIICGLNLKNKKKGPACAACAYGLICDGLWQEYAAHAGFGELKTVQGKRIEEPFHFMKQR